MSILKEYLGDFIDAASNENFYPVFNEVSASASDPISIVNGKEVILICSPNYLGLANHPEVCQAAIKAIEKYGAGTTGSAYTSGYLDLFKKLEERIAEYMGTEASIVYNSASSANIGVISAIMNPVLIHFFKGFIPDNMKSRAIFFDKDNHASLYEAAKLASANKTYYYEHNDMEHLEQLLKNSKHGCKLIVTDGYFSMGADLANLPKIVELAEKYKAMVFVDDAHATGVLGKNGRGTAEHFGLECKIDFIVGSLAKGFGIRGGFLAGSHKLVKYLRISSRRYLFSGMLPPSVPAAVLTAIDIATKEPWRRVKVLENAEYMRSQLEDFGCKMSGELHIVSWFIGDQDIAIAVTNELMSRGIFATCVRYPAVMRDQSLIRFLPIAIHTKQQLDEVIFAVKQIALKYKLTEEIRPELVCAAS
jgi:8-amino-7-oxononanoate synthase